MNATTRTILVLLGACAVAAALRLGAWLPNVAAVGALALYSGSRLPLWFAWIAPIGVMAGTDLLLEQWFGYPPFNRVVYVSFLIDVVIGMLLVRRVTWLRVGLAGFIGALQFYLITNFVVWLGAHPVYSRDVSGLMACYIAALPFFGYTLLGNLVFGAAAFGADALLARAASPATVPSETR